MQPLERKQFGIAVSPKVFDGIAARAKTLGLSPTAYAKILLEAGYAARIGHERGTPVSDAELDEQVKLVFACAGQGNAAAICKATGVKETLVIKILDGFKTSNKQGKSP